MMIDEKKLFKNLFIVNGKRIPFVDCDNMPLTITYKDLYKILKNQPKVGKWIPVEEGLPESLEFVDITFTYETFFGEIGYMSSVAKYDGYVWWNTDGDIVDENVIAWKPRSEPYRKEDIND